MMTTKNNNQSEIYLGVSNVSWDPEDVKGTLTVYGIEAFSERDAIEKFDAITGWIDIDNDSMDEREMQKDEIFVRPLTWTRAGPSGYVRLKDLSVKKLRNILSFLTDYTLGEIYEDEILDYNGPDEDIPPFKDWLKDREAKIEHDIKFINFIKNVAYSTNEIEVEDNGDSLTLMLEDMNKCTEPPYGMLEEINAMLEVQWNSSKNDEAVNRVWENVIMEEEEEVTIVEVKKAKIEIIDLTGEDEEEVVVKKAKKETAKSKSVQCSYVFTRGKKKDKRCMTKTKKENGMCAKHSFVCKT